MCPILFRLGGFTVYAYGFFIAVGFVVGFALATRAARKKGIPFERVVDLFFYTILSSILGSRILFVLTDLGFFLEHPLKILNVWEGGLVFYGGLLAAVGVSLVYMKLHRLPVWRLADLFCPPIALGLFFGRIGCFFAGCCYGKETSLPWGVVFKNPESLARLNVVLHPTQLYDAANGLAIFVVLIWLEKRKTFEGEVFWAFIFLYSMTRCFIEALRDDPRGSFLGSALSPSQGIGIALAITSLFMLFYLRRVSRR
jgi:phosphatidylglycerol---prolipoprotein diacylglyceryl transferase